jgi:hypothetical protein
MTQPNITELCQNEALGQTLSEWGDFSYDDIIDALYNDNDEILEHEDFMRWDALEDMSNSELADYIESLTRAFHLVAKQAVELSQESK